MDVYHIKMIFFFSRKHDSNNELKSEHVFEVEVGIHLLSPDCISKPITELSDIIKSI